MLSSLSCAVTHYHRVHTEKPFVCTTCPHNRAKRYALQWELTAHQKQCGKKFKCGDCEQVLGSQRALLRHCRKANHSVPPDIKYTRRGSSKGAKTPQKKQQAAGTAEEGCACTQAGVDGCIYD